MEGEFLVEDTVGLASGVGGGNFLILAERPDAALRRPKRRRSDRRARGVILPFPGGIVRSGTKIGSRYKGLVASTNDAYCPTLRGRTKATSLPPEAESVLELVIDGLDEAAVARATALGVRAPVALVDRRCPCHRCRQLWRQVGPVSLSPAPLAGRSRRLRILCRQRLSSPAAAARRAGRRAPAAPMASARRRDR